MEAELRSSLCDSLVPPALRNTLLRSCNEDTGQLNAKPGVFPRDGRVQGTAPWSQPVNRGRMKPLLLSQTREEPLGRGGGWSSAYWTRLRASPEACAVSWCRAQWTPLVWENGAQIANQSLLSSAVVSQGGVSSVRPTEGRGLPWFCSPPVQPRVIGSTQDPTVGG